MCKQRVARGQAEPTPREVLQDSRVALGALTGQRVDVG